MYIIVLLAVVDSKGYTSRSPFLRDLTNIGRLTSEFAQLLEDWRSWDKLTAIQNHKTVANHLMKLRDEMLAPFWRVSNTTQPNPFLESTFTRILALDAVALCANLTLLMTDKTQYKHVLDRRGAAAQTFLDLLQAVRHPSLCRRPSPYDFTPTPESRPPDRSCIQASTCQSAHSIITSIPALSQVHGPRRSRDGSGSYCSRVFRRHSQSTNSRTRHRCQSL